MLLKFVYKNTFSVQAIAPFLGTNPAGEQFGGKPYRLGQRKKETEVAVQKVNVGSPSVI